MFIMKNISNVLLSEKKLCSKSYVNIQIKYIKEYLGVPAQNK